MDSAIENLAESSGSGALAVDEDLCNAPDPKANLSVSDQNSENCSFESSSSLMSDLLAQQDQVIQKLENLDQQLLSTIEAFRASTAKAGKEAASEKGSEGESPFRDSELQTSGESPTPGESVESSVKRAA